MSPANSMATMDHSSNDPSFRKAPPQNSNILRSISTKESTTNDFSEFPHSPPRLSCPSLLSSRSPISSLHHLSLNLSTSSEFPKEFPISPPRLSCPTLSRSLQNSPFSSPPHPHSPTNKLSESQTTYHCASSVLRKDGQILCVALSNNGLIYTGSDSNVVRIWRLPEFTECGQLRTKACRVVSLEVSNDRIYAAYGDGKIRVWRRTWDRVLRHVRLGTIPKTVGYVRSYIAGRDKTVSLQK